MTIDMIKIEFYEQMSSNTKLKIGHCRSQNIFSIKWDKTTYISVSATRINGSIKTTLIYVELDIRLDIRTGNSTN